MKLRVWKNRWLEIARPGSSGEFPGELIEDVLVFDSVLVVTTSLSVWHARSLRFGRYLVLWWTRTPAWWL